MSAMAIKLVSSRLVLSCTVHTYCSRVPLRTTYELQYKFTVLNSVNSDAKFLRVLANSSPMCGNFAKTLCIFFNGECGNFLRKVTGFVSLRKARRILPLRFANIFCLFVGVPDFPSVLTNTQCGLGAYARV